MYNNFNRIYKKTKIETLETITGNKYSKDNIIDDSVAVIMDGSGLVGQYTSKSDYSGFINAYNNDFQFSNLNKYFARRELNSIIIVPVSKNIFLDSVNVFWNRDFTNTFLCTSPVFYNGFIEQTMVLYSADNPIYGDIKTSLLEVDNDYVMLDSTSDINLFFKTPANDIPQGYIRDFVLVVNGRYENNEDKIKTNSVGKNNILPLEYQLNQNYPNPFNSKTNIKYQIPNTGIVKIIIYDLLGREVKTLVNEYKQPGTYQVSFNAEGLSSGIYFYRMRSGDFTETKKLVLIK